LPILLDQFPRSQTAAPESAVLVRSVPRAMLGALHATFARAASGVGGVDERDYAMGGHALRVRFAGEGLTDRLTPALQHVEIRAGHPDLTVCAWDAATTGVSIREWSAGLAVDKPAATDPDVLVAFEEGASEAYYWVRDGESLPVWDRGAPLRTMLHWWLTPRAKHLIHAAAVGYPTGGVLLGGPSGSGKSTSALACIGSGLSYMGDDYVVVGSAPEPTVYSIYRSAKLHGGHAGRLPHLLPLIRNPSRLETEKALLFIDDSIRAFPGSGMPLRAILLPRVTGGRDSGVRATSRPAALRALAPSTLLQSPGVGAETFRAIAELALRLPCYELELGTDLGQVPTIVSRLLEAA
jgi:hypothetical protein